MQESSGFIKPRAQKIMSIPSSIAVFLAFPMQNVDDRLVNMVHLTRLTWNPCRMSILQWPFLRTSSRLQFPGRYYGRKPTVILAVCLSLPVDLYEYFRFQGHQNWGSNQTQKQIRTKTTWIDAEWPPGLTGENENGKYLAIPEFHSDYCRSAH